MAMDRINNAPPSFADTFGSTSAAVSSPEPRRSSRLRASSLPCKVPCKRKRLASEEPARAGLEQGAVKKRKVKLTSQAHKSEKDKPSTQKPGKKETAKVDTVVSELSNSKGRRIRQQKAIKDIEQWLNEKGIDTESLKQSQAKIDSRTFIEEKLSAYMDRGNKAAIVCRDAFDELASVFDCFKTKHDKKKDIETLRKLIAQTERLKSIIAIDEKMYDSLNSLRKKILKQLRARRYAAETRDYANALYAKGQELMNSALPDVESSATNSSKVNEGMELLGSMLGIIPKPKKKKLKQKQKKAYSSDYHHEKRKKAKAAISRLTTILQERYNIEILKPVPSKVIHVAKESILQLRQHGELPAKIYKNTDFTGRYRKGDSSLGPKSNKECGQLHRKNLEGALFELQEVLQTSIVNKNDKPDMEKTVLMACDVLDRNELDNQQPETVEKVTEEMAYAELNEVLNRSFTISFSPDNPKELICAAGYCLYALLWREPLTQEEYRRFRSRQPVAPSPDTPPGESVDIQLNSLKELLKEVSLHPEDIDELQGVEIIRAAVRYLNDMGSQGLTEPAPFS